MAARKKPVKPKKKAAAPQEGLTPTLWYPSYYTTPIKVEIDVDGAGQVTIIGDEARQAISDLAEVAVQSPRTGKKLNFVVRSLENPAELILGSGGPEDEQLSDSCCPC